MRATPIPQSARIAVRVRERLHCARCNIPLYSGHWHHRRSRSVRDQHTHHPCNGLWLCSTCHDWVHAHPFLARPNGWIVLRSVAEPGAVPFRTPNGWRRPDCEGGGALVQAACLEEAIEKFNA